MKHKLKGNKLIDGDIVSPETEIATFSESLTKNQINGDIVSPETEIATFSESLTKNQIKRLVLDMKFGHEMLTIYQNHRENMNITNVCDFLEMAEKLFQKYTAECHAIHKGWQLHW